MVYVEHVHLNDVAHRKCCYVVVALDDYEQVLALGQSAKVRQCFLGGRRSAGDQGFDDVNAVVASAVRQGAAQCSSLHLLGGALAVVTRGRAVYDATTGHVRSTDGTLTGAAGALLSVRLATCAGNLGAGLGLVRTLTSSSQLGHNDLVQQRNVRLDIKDPGGEFDVECLDRHVLMLPSRQSGRGRPCHGGRERHP